MTEAIAKIYPAKLLLFGEYSVIHGGDSLAIPYAKRYAYWKFDSSKIDSRLVDFLSYLKKLKELDLDLIRFESDIQQGLYLESTIPIGYGAGSSGSVVAAVYDRFKNSSESIEPSDLKVTFARMESFFHGSSSGLDPLVSYLDAAVYIRNGKISTSQVTVNPILTKLFLFDTCRTRSTSKLVSWYKSQLESKDFILGVSDPMTKLSSDLIRALFIEDEIGFSNMFKSLSQLQSENFSPMFPSEINQNLKRITAVSGGSFKLCGAGGGGYFLGYLPNYDFEKIPADIEVCLIPIL